MTVLKHLRGHKPEMLKRAILLTSTPDAVLKTIAGDVSAVVKKPFVTDELIAPSRAAVNEQRLNELRALRDKLFKTMNKTPALKAEIDKLDRAINKVLSVLQKFETHWRR